MTMTARATRDGRGGASIRMLTLVSLLVGAPFLLPSAASGETTTFANASPILVPPPGAARVPGVSASQ